MRTFKTITAIIAVGGLILLLSIVFWFIYLINKETKLEEKSLAYGGMYKVTQHVNSIMTGSGIGYRVYFRLSKNDEYTYVTGWEKRGNITHKFDIFDDHNLIVIIPPRQSFENPSIHILNKDPTVNQLRWRSIWMNFPSDQPEKISNLSYHALSTTLDEETIVKIYDSRKKLVKGNYSPDIINFNLETRKMNISYPLSDDKEQLLQFQLSEYGTRIRLLDMEIKNRQDEPH